MLTKDSWREADRTPGVELPLSTWARPTGEHADSIELDVCLPFHSIHVVGQQRDRAAPFRRFLLKITGYTKEPTVAAFIDSLNTGSPSLEKKHKNGWCETGEQLKGCLEYLLALSADDLEQRPSFRYNCSPTMLECLSISNASQVVRDCRLALNLQGDARLGFKVLEEIDRILFPPGRGGQRTQALVLPPSQWSKDKDFLEEIQRGGFSVEQTSLDTVSFQACLSRLQELQTAAAPCFQLLRLTGDISPFDLERSFGTAQANDSLVLLLLADRRALRALFLKGILQNRSNTVRVLDSENQEEMMLFKQYGKDTQLGQAILDIHHRCQADPELQLYDLDRAFETISQELEEARQLLEVRGGAFVQLVYGDIEAAKEALSQERSGQLRVLDARSESYLQKQAP